MRRLALAVTATLMVSTVAGSGLVCMPGISDSRDAATRKCALPFEETKFCDALASAADATCEEFSAQICMAARSEHSEKCTDSWKLAKGPKTSSIQPSLEGATALVETAFGGHAVHSSTQHCNNYDSDQVIRHGTDFVDSEEACVKECSLSPDCYYATWYASTQYCAIFRNGCSLAHHPNQPTTYKSTDPCKADYTYHLDVGGLDGCPRGTYCDPTTYNGESQPWLAGHRGCRCRCFVAPWTQGSHCHPEPHSNPASSSTCYNSQPWMWNPCENLCTQSCHATESKQWKDSVPRDQQDPAFTSYKAGVENFQAMVEANDGSGKSKVALIKCAESKAVWVDRDSADPSKYEAQEWKKSECLEVCLCCEHTTGQGPWESGDLSPACWASTHGTGGDAKCLSAGSKSSSAEADQTFVLYNTRGGDVCGAWSKQNCFQGCNVPAPYNLPGDPEGWCKSRTAML